MNNIPYDSLQLGRNIRTRRTAQHLTQTELARLAGCSPQTVSKLERGLCGISVELLFRLSAALTCRLSELAEGV